MYANGCQQAPRLGQPRPLLRVAVADQVDVHVPHRAGSIVPCGANDLVPPGRGGGCRGRDSGGRPRRGVPPRRAAPPQRREPAVAAAAARIVRRSAPERPDHALHPDGRVERRHRAGALHHASRRHGGAERLRARAPAPSPRARPSPEGARRGRSCRDRGPPPSGRRAGGRRLPRDPCPTGAAASSRRRAGRGGAAARRRRRRDPDGERPRRPAAMATRSTGAKRLEGHQGLRPEPSDHEQLLFQARPRVPNSAPSEAYSASSIPPPRPGAGGRRSGGPPRRPAGDERGLPLREHEHAGHELESARDAGQEREDVKIRGRGCRST